MNQKSWLSLENHIRNLATVLFNCPFKPDRIDGVNYDAVGYPSDEEMVIIEITEERSLDKIRTDIAKIASLKYLKTAESIFLRAFILLKEKPTQGMIDAAKPHKIQVLTVEDFSSKIFDYSSYTTSRNNTAFGSSIDPITGKADTNQYIPVSYFSNEETKKFSIQEICENLNRKNKIILLGDYGTGKSRCVREAFHILSDDYLNISSYPLAINLREHWGAQTAVEIISGHFQRLGLSGSIDRAMQLLASGNILLLLDGFDEVGTQTFGNSQDRRENIRKQALSGVRELLGITTGGVLITGRPHYFNDNTELLNALGLSLRSFNTKIFKCRDEFDEQQANAYLAALGYIPKTPKWLPKKPLMFQIIASMERVEAERILNSSDLAEISFWGQFIDTVCQREARMHSSIEADTVRNVLSILAKFTRQNKHELGRFSPKDIQKAYELATGDTPDESGQLMLSRLCTLGRIEPESPDRQFVDPYIIQLLFADCLVDDISYKNIQELDVSYQQPLQAMGLYFLTDWLETYQFEDEAYSYLQVNQSAKNKQLISEIAVALMHVNDKPIDFNNLEVSGAEISMMFLGFRKCCNITFRDNIIHYLSMEDCKINESDNFLIKNSEIITASGLSSLEALPVWMLNSKPINTDNISTTSRIKSSILPPSQKLFLSIIQKIFFQRGGGRKENSLYKGGFGQGFDRKIIDEILKILVADGIIEKSKDSNGFIYNPRREYTARMKAIKDQLSLSKDPLWIKVGEITR